MLSASASVSSSSPSSVAAATTATAYYNAAADAAAYYATPVSVGSAGCYADEFCYDEAPVPSGSFLPPSSHSGTSFDTTALPERYPAFDHASVATPLPWWNMSDLTPYAASAPTHDLVDPFALYRPRTAPSQMLTAFDYATAAADEAALVAAFAPVRRDNRSDADATPVELFEAAAAALVITTASPPAASMTGPVRVTQQRRQQRRRAATLDSDSGASSTSDYRHNDNDGDGDGDDGMLTCRWGACGNTFATSEQLASHLVDDHVPHRQPEYRCMWAGCKRARHAFQHRDKIRLHVRLHGNYRPFACTHAGCSRTFARADSLDAHVRTHSVEGRTNPCRVAGCDKRYFHMKSLRKHERTAHGVDLDGADA